MLETISKKAAKIRLVIFDVDGVLTDGSLFFDAEGQEYKAFYARDGLGMKMLQSTGVIIAIITARSSPVVKHRMDNLGIEHVYQGQLDKLATFKQLVTKLKIEPQQIAYVGDDVIDIAVMLQVGLAIAVADAHALTIKHSHWQTQALGGRGAAREVCELIMQAQATFESELSKFGISNDK